MPARRRFGVATAASVGFHALVLVLIGLLSSRARAPAEVLIPIELTMAQRQPEVLALGGGGRPEAEVRRTAAPALVKQPTKREPSSPGGRLKAAPAPPRVLTAKSGKEPAGPVGQGREPAGPGGQEDVPAGPTHGPGIVGGPLAVYPKDALDQGLEGTVTLSVAVGADGSVQSVAVAKGSGHKVLDDAAARAVKGWQFEAGMEKGKPAAGKVTVTLVFSAGTVKRG